MRPILFLTVYRAEKAIAPNELTKFSIQLNDRLDASVYAAGGAFRGRPRINEEKGAHGNKKGPEDLYEFLWALDICISGGTGRNRTADTRIFSPLLYRLSYRPNTNLS
jgi:hypothetical protein